MIKYTITALSLLLFYASSSAQNTDTIQPDSLYRKYKVRSRKTIIENAYPKVVQVFLFDQSGRYSGFILTDNETGKKPQMTMYYQYNDAGIITAENDTIFRGNQYAIKVVEFSYSPTGKVVKKVVKNDGNILSETSYAIAEYAETEKLFRNGSLYREQTTYYDKHNKKIRFTGTELADKDDKPKVFEVNGKKYTMAASTEDSKWDYIFKNTYDEKGNLINQERLVNGKVKDEINFTYDDRGLLKEMRESGRGTTKFEYTYY